MKKITLKGSETYSRLVNLVVIFLNVLLLSGVFLLYMFYVKAYQDRLSEENLGNIANLNQSASVNVISLFEGWSVKLDDVIGYVQKHEMTHKQAMEMICDANSSPSRYFELIGKDGKGYQAKKDADGRYIELDYSSSSYSSLHDIFKSADAGSDNALTLTPEYTDGGETAAKFVAMYKYIPIREEDGSTEYYTLLLATESKNLLTFINNQSDYSGQSTVLTDAEGNYIVSSADFKSANFFQYLYVYNDLSLDEKNKIYNEMAASGNGELYYKNGNSVIEDCVFRFDRMEKSGWYCITSVPLSSFHTPALNSNYVIYAISLLFILLLVDILWLQGMNQRLRISILREKDASTAKGNFMSRMSHEIRTPLNAVIGYNTIARSEIAHVRSEYEYKQAQMKVSDCLLKSEIASKHLLTIINDVLDMSAIESGKIQMSHESFDFKGLITSLTTIFYSQARAKGIDFEVVFDTLTEEWFVGDQMRTNQILTNLLSNAIKFTPEGGTVRLKIQQPEADTNASYIHFEVSDTGIGMAPEYLEHIWLPFEQADPSISRRFGGTGLGLSITKNLVDLMNGTISVTSALGAGTTFCIDLTFDKAVKPQSRVVYDFSSVNALVVDDDASTCDYIRLLFNRCGAKCATVTSGADAIDAVNVAHDRNDFYSICLIDWRMPNMDGIETIRHIREIAGDEMPIIVLTAYDFAELADKAAEVGVNKFISKPLFQSSLFDLLANTNGKQASKSTNKSKNFDFEGARILLAEDNAMNMEIAKTIMESSGLIVDCAWNGREAIELFEASEPKTYMTILMDVHMPEMNGHDAARAIRASSRPDAQTVPIIAMTADAFAENVAEAHASGMNGHIAKPIDLDILFETLQKYADYSKNSPR